MPLSDSIYNYSRLVVVYTAAQRKGSVEISNFSSGDYWTFPIITSTGGTGTVICSGTYRTYQNSLSFVSFVGKTITAENVMSNMTTNSCRIYKVTGYKH